MFAAPVAKPKAKTAAPSKNTSLLQRATPFGHRHNDSGEYLRMLQQSIGNQAVLRLLRRQGLLENKHGDPGQHISPESVSAEGGPRGLAWAFSKIPLFPPKRMSGEFQSPSQFPAPLLPGAIQAKLKVGAVNDPLEREADRVAEQVMRMPAPTSAPPQVSRKCDACEEEEKLKRKPTGPHAATGEAPAIVHDVLRSPGQPLDAATRAHFEPRFGHDFSRVRVHTGTSAEQSAREVNAQAYTVGHNIVFDAGRLAPGTHEGRRLIAHELAHVVQQTSAAAVVALQRDPKKEENPKPAAPSTQKPPAPPAPAVPQDFAVLLSPDEEFVTLATAIAPGAKVLHATSVEDLAKQLKAIKVPIGTLFFVAHMDEDGDLVFTSPGKETFVRAETIASKVKDSAQVESIDFRGCNLAQAPAEMDKIRVALKATKVTGSTCSLVSQIAGPIMIGSKAITQPKDLTDKNKTAFDDGFKKIHEIFVDAKKKCIINDSVDGYFQTGGRLIAYWANPGSMADQAGWDDKKSVCYKDLKVEKVDPTKKIPVIGPDDCKLVEVGKK
jgi:hypothetical protein